LRRGSGVVGGGRLAHTQRQFFASEESSWISGVVLDVAGGAVVVR